MRYSVFVLAAALCAQNPPPKLKPGQTIHSSVSEKAAQSYSIELSAGQFLSAILRPLDGDMVVSLRSPSGETLVSMATADVPKAIVRILCVAETSGRYRMEVKADRTAGRYALEVQKPHPPNPAELKRAQAQRLYSRAAAEIEKYNYDQAVKLYERAADLFRETKDSAGEGAALFKLGNAKYDTDDGTNAVATYERARIIARSYKDRRLEGRVLANIANARSQLDQMDAAIAIYAQASRLLREVGDRRREMYVLFSLGIAYQKLSRYKEAIAINEQALSMARELGDRLIEGCTLSAVGYYHYCLGDQERAIDFGERGLAILREIRNRIQEEWTLINLGVAYQDTSRFEKAQQDYNDALKIAREIKDRRGEATILLNLGWFHSELGESAEAVPQFEQALSALREIKDRRREANTLTSLGGTYRELKDYPKALEFEQQALSILREIKDRGFEVITLLEIGEVYTELGEQQKAIDYNNQALALNREITGQDEFASALSNLGAAYRHLHDFDKAISYHTRALALSRRAKDPRQEIEALTGLMDDWGGQGQPRLAVFYGKQAINTLQSLRSSMRGLTKDLQKSFLRKNEMPYHTLAELLIVQGRLAEAEQVLALLKQEEYFEYIRRDSNEGTSLERKAALTAEEAEWEKRYEEAGGRLMAAGVERSELVAKQNRSSAETLRLAQLDRDVQAGNIAFEKFAGELTQHFSAKTEARLRINEIHETQGLMEDLKELPSGTVIIYTIVGEDKTYAILRTPDTQKAYELPIKNADLNRKVRDFREAVLDPQSDPRPLASDLYRILISPMAVDLQQAGARTLMWSLDGVLRYLPLAALYDGREYLIEQYGLSVITLASNARLKDRPDSTWRAAGFGVTKGFDGSPPLPDVVSELAAIKDILHGEIKLDGQFTEASMRETLLKRYPVVHIASHFRFMPGDESKSFLLLGDGSHLSLKEVRTLPNLFGGVQLLTLSACNTALGDGSEVESFGTLAQRQGAKAVIASLWPVADASTSRMMEEFYRIRESSAGITKLEALREAQLKLLRGAGSPYAHPYYWAAFFLMGNWL
jgi:CHAT domain-containing protein